MTTELAYLPGRTPPKAGPLARFLPPIPEGIGQRWLQARLPQGAWVIDPFGAAPHLAVDAARAGYRVLVAANNPVARLLLEMTASPPTEQALRAALAELASSFKGDERVEPHIKSLYRTECVQCGAGLTAEYFVWDRLANSPSHRVYHCPNCGDAGEKPVSELDGKRVKQFSNTGLHRARALERIASRDDPDRPHVEEALNAYLPRAIYALLTLINRFEGLTLAPEKQLHLAALLLSACDQANTLWPHPTVRERPRQLTVPPRFREYNVWWALEQAIGQWASPLEDGGTPPHVRLVLWPEQPPETGGISLYEGRLKDLVSVDLPVSLSAALGSLPRPNQAFWTLSALWSGWLWGQEAIGPFKSVLRRRRYDWGWHTAALEAAMRNLASLLDPGAPFFGLVPEPEPGFATAALTAADRAGFDIEGVAGRAEEGPLQIVWRSSTRPQSEEVLPEERFTHTAVQAARNFLQERGQPSSYFLIHTAAAAALASERLFSNLESQSASSETSPAAEASAAEAFAQAQALLKETFSYRSGFRRFNASDQSLEIGEWWLRDEKEACLPWFDRVEVSFVPFLQQNPGCRFSEIEAALCEQFKGLHTPEREHLRMLLESYGEQTAPGSEQWMLRRSDHPAARRKDLETNRDLLVQFGERLGYTVRRTEIPLTSRAGTEVPFRWEDSQGRPVALFYVLASSAFGGMLFPERDSAHNLDVSAPLRVIVLPGSRAGLAAYKLDNDPRLRQAAERWIFLKYRHLRRLFENPAVQPENLEDQLALDPLTNNDPQMRLL